MRPRYLCNPPASVGGQRAGGSGRRVIFSALHSSSSCTRVWRGTCRYIEIDVLLIAGSSIALVACVWDLRRNRLPLWLTRQSWVQQVAVVLAFLFMVVFAFGELTLYLDDDIFIHLPNIKQIAMGDIPPHVPYFPNTFLRGHIGRDLYTGIIARLLDLRPELAIVYVTLAVCPAYILIFHALARRLGEERDIPTSFCFVGLLFFVSFVVEPFAIRAGIVTYVMNNNAFAYSYVVFFGWLLYRALELKAFSPSLIRHWRSIATTAVIVVSYTALYFIYVSHFMLLSLFMAAIPFLITAFARTGKARVFFETGLWLTAILACSCILQLAVSPFFLERVAISLGFATTDEPIGFVQQATLTFPKEHLFSITSPSGEDFFFFSWKSLSAQGISFYLGLMGLFVGISYRKPALAGCSLFGGLVMLWLFLVDMGQYRAETLRVLVPAHMGFGAATGLMLGFLLEGSLRALRFRFRTYRFTLQGRSVGAASLYLQIAVAAVFVLFGAWMARGSYEKFAASGYWDVKAAAVRLTKIVERRPEDWFASLNSDDIDFETFTILADLVSSPQERVLLKLVPDERHRQADPLSIYYASQMINAAAISGAGVVGVAQEHGPPRMGVAIYPSGYQASLFWREPSSLLLDQMSPDWIVIDPSLISSDALSDIRSMPGVTLMRDLRDDAGRQRLIFQYSGVGDSAAAAPVDIARIAFAVPEVHTTPFGVARVKAEIQPPLGRSFHLLMEVRDEDGNLANTMDMPLVPVQKLSGGQVRDRDLNGADGKMACSIPGTDYGDPHLGPTADRRRGRLTRRCELFGPTGPRWDNK